MQTNSPQINQLDNTDSKHAKRPANPPPFEAPSITVSCGANLDELLFMARGLWYEVNKLATCYHYQMDISAGGCLVMSINDANIIYGTVVFKSVRPAVELKVDTLLNHLEGSTGAYFHLPNSFTAINWTADLVKRIMRLDEIWDKEVIGRAIVTWHERVYGYPPQ